MIKNITSDIIYIGVQDNVTHLFEAQYPIPKGISYNSYVVLDEKITVFDSVEAKFTYEWLDNIKAATNEKAPDYLVVQHMEPDHSANLLRFTQVYPQAKIVANAKAFAMMEKFYASDFDGKKIVVQDGETLCTGKHTFTFCFAPMVHWPEVMVSYDNYEKALFSADAFGTFGTIEKDEAWENEARRYYIGIVAKYGVQVQKLLKKASELDIGLICPLHGPVLSDDIKKYLSFYDIWSSYAYETDGIVIAYASIYGNTKKAAEILKIKLNELGCPNIIMHDLTTCDLSLAISDAFRYSKLVLCATTYNSGIFPAMQRFINGLCERSFQNRTIGLIENGSWAPLANKLMAKQLEGCKNLTYLENKVTIHSAIDGNASEQIKNLASELCEDYIAKSPEKANKNDLSALFKIGYGLYVVTCKDEKRDNGLIVNTVSQLTDTPKRVSVTINKDNFSHHIIKQTGVMIVNCLNVQAPFSVFERFGFKSGSNTDKFEGIEKPRADNGVVFLNKYINSFISLKVINYLDMETHGMFICEITEARVLNSQASMTYAYYHENVKPKPPTQGAKGWVCDICGYIHEDDNLPEDFICPLCKHGASDFSKLG